MSVPEIFGMAAGGCTRAFVRLIANWSMSMSETTPPNGVGRLSSLAAIREPTVAVECYLAQHLDRRLAATRKCHVRALIVVLKNAA